MRDDARSQAATAAVAIMALALAGGLAPLALREYYPVARPGTRVVAHVPSIGSCFSGGLLIAAGFIHLLADAAEQLDGGAYPWASFLCALGFIGVMLIEHAARVCLAVRVGRHRRFGRSRRSSVALVHGCAPCCNWEQVGAASEGEWDESPRPGAARADSRFDDDDGEVGMAAALARGDGFTVGVTFAAFAVHSALEGVALGVTDEIFQVFLAIAAHKLFAAFALGNSLARARDGAGRPLLPVAMVGGWVLAFALLTPLGILTGQILSANGSRQGGAPAVALALAAGTFVYVGAVEVLEKELEPADDERPAVSAAKLAAAAAGFGAMALLGVWV